MTLATKPTTEPRPVTNPTIPGVDPTSDLPADQIANPAFGALAADATLERTVAALKAKGYAVKIAENGEMARDLIVGLIPQGAEVSQGASETLEQIGVTREIETPGRFDAIRPRTRAMDRSTPEGIRAMRKLGVGPDYYVVSAHAVTEGGTIVIASNTGSQLAPISFGAGEVIFAIGTQKIVPDLDSAMRRIEEYSLPLEHQRMQLLHGVNSQLNKILIINKEFRSGRFTIVLIKEQVGA